MINPRRDRSLILYFAAPYVVCFDKPRRELIRVQIEGDVLSCFVPPRPGYFLSYKRPQPSELQSNDPIIRGVDEILVDLPLRSDCIKLEHGSFKICSWVGFSSNSSHVTFNRRVGFSDWYGLVDTSTQGWKFECDLYKAYIVLDDLDYKRNGTFLFRLDNFTIRKFSLYERRMFFDKLEMLESGNDRGRSAEPPSDLSESVPMPGDEAIDAIVLAVEDTTAICFSELFESQIRVCMPHSMPVNKGDQVKFSNHDYQNDVYIPNSKNTKVRKCQKVRYRNDVMTIEAIAACSDVPHHLTYRKRLAFAGQFGIVQLIEDFPAKGRAFHVELAIHDLDAVKNGTHLFQVAAFKRQLSDTENEEFMNRLRDFEDRQECWEDLPTELVVPSGEVQGPSNSTSNNVNVDIAAYPEVVPQSGSTPSVSSPPNEEPEEAPLSSRIPNDYQPARSQFPIPSVGNSYIPEDSLKSSAVVTAKTDDYFVVYLHERNGGAFLRCFGSETPAIIVGTVFKCTYAVAAMDGLFWEVTNVLEINAGVSKCRVVDGKCQMQFKIDLSRRNKEFEKNWMQLGGCPIVESEIGYITMKQLLKDPQGNVMKCHDLARMYLGRRMASEMIGWCEFERYDVPRMTVDAGYIGNESVSTFGWRIVEVYGSEDHVQRMEMVELESNIGEMNMEELEQEDDVARQKRLNKAVSEYGSCVSSRAPSTYGGDSLRYPGATSRPFNLCHQVDYSRNWNNDQGDRHMRAPYMIPAVHMSDPKTKQIADLQNMLRKFFHSNDRLCRDAQDLIRILGSNADTVEIESSVAECLQVQQEFRSVDRYLMH